MYIRVYVMRYVGYLHILHVMTLPFFVRNKRVISIIQLLYSEFFFIYFILLRLLNCFV